MRTPAFHRPRARLPIVLAVAALILDAGACAVQPAAPVQLCPTDSIAPVVVDPWVEAATPRRVRMGGPLQVWLRLPTPRPNLDSLQLYIDGHPIPGLHATPIGARCTLRSGKNVAGYLEVHEFVLERNDESRAMWAHLLGNPTAFARDVRVGAGVTKGEELKIRPPVGSTQVEFEVADVPLFIVVTLVFIALLGLLVWAAVNTALLRDPAPVPNPPPSPPTDGADDPKPPAPPQAPYSLAKFVMAMWTFLILGGFFAIWLITGDYRGILTPQALLLMGIVGVTTGVSAAITRNKNGELAREGRELRMQLAALRRTRKEMEVREKTMDQAARTAFRPQLDDVDARIGEKETLLATVRADAPGAKGVLTDLLSDGNGPAFYRFQNLAWNVAFALVFVLATYRMLAFPAFDATIMTLMGISETLYLGMKLVSPPKPPTQGPERSWFWERK